MNEFEETGQKRKLCSQKRPSKRRHFRSASSSSSTRDTNTHLGSRLVIIIVELIIVNKPFIMIIHLLLITVSCIYTIMWSSKI